MDISDAERPKRRPQRDRLPKFGRRSCGTYSTLLRPGDTSGSKGRFLRPREMQR